MSATETVVGPELRFEELCVSRGGRRVLHDVSLAIPPGEITTLLGKVIRHEAPESILDQYDLHRRPLNVEFVQQQTIANKKRMEEKDPAARQKDQDQLRRTAEDPALHRAYVRKASLIESVKKREAFAA